MDETLLAGHRQRVEQALEARLPPTDHIPARLHEAMRYAVLNGGKRMRPVLVYSCGEALGVEPEALDGPACAVELIHCYSLVHDDLPSMDDDDLRRGRPTCHKAFDEATALLVGDALQSLAFEVLAGHEPGPAPERRARMVLELARSAGSRGMAGGQAIDLAAVGRQLSVAELENMHIHKTGALIRVCATLAGLCAPAADTARLEALDHYAKCLGLAYQVHDDVLDVEGDTTRLGKTAGADASRDKPTYPALLGLEDARSFARQLAIDAVESLSVFGAEADPLRDIAEFIVGRDN